MSVDKATHGDPVQVRKLYPADWLSMTAMIYGVLNGIVNGTAATVPTHMAPTGSMALFVEGVAPVISKDSFKLRFTTSPVALEDSTFIAGDATFGVIGAGYPIPY
jgi:hypothetical protein